MYRSIFKSILVFALLSLSTSVGARAQEVVDNFGNDDRAMSPRSWSNPTGTTRLPTVSFDRPIRPPRDESSPRDNTFRQVESSREKQSPNFFETSPLPPRAQESESEKSPIPNSVLDSSPPNDDETEATVDGSQFDNPSIINENRGATHGPWFADDCNAPTVTKYNPVLGHRYPIPLERGIVSSSVSKFSFEEDGDFPPASEIIAQSIFFSEFEFLYLQPSFQNNAAVTTNAAGNFQTSPFNFDLAPAFRVQGGFASEYGPGFAAEYFQFDNQSDTAQFISDGVASGTSSVNFESGTLNNSAIIADAPGEAINTMHTLEIHSTSVFAFKAIKFKRAYVNGRFGLQIVSIETNLESTLSNAFGAQIGRLRHAYNLDAFGPRFGIDYVRRIGHTPAQLIASSTSSILFGDRDQVIENTVSNELVMLGADEFVTVFDIFLGVQGKRIRGEKRNTTYRVGFVNQSWMGGGSALDPSSGFGFQGISLMLGFNR